MTKDSKSKIKMIIKQIKLFLFCLSVDCVFSYLSMFYKPMFYKGGKKRKGYEEPVVMLENFNLFCHKQCQLPVLLSISGIRYYL